MLAPREETLVPLRSPRVGLPPVTHVRSTLLAASLATVRERGRMEEYTARLAPDHEVAISQLVAGVWLPMAVALAHYQAVEALGFTTREAFENGRLVAARVQSTALGTVARVAQGAFATPWSGLAHFQRLWDRVLMGGAVGVYKLGPKDARIEAHGIALARIPYVRAGWGGVIAASSELFCQRAYVVELPRLCGPMTVAYRLSWA